MKVDIEMEEDCVKILLNEVEAMNDQDFVHRYSGRASIKDQNLAEHHAHTAQILLILFERFEVPEDVQLKTLKRALVHDLPETELSDIPYPSHVKYGSLSEAYDSAEKSVIEDKYGFIADCFDIDKGSDEWKLVKFADRFDRLAFMFRELSLGNKTEYFKNALSEEMHYVRDMYDELRAIFCKDQK